MKLFGFESNDYFFSNLNKADTRQRPVQVSFSRGNDAKFLRLMIPSCPFVSSKLVAAAASELHQGMEHRAAAAESRRQGGNDTRRSLVMTGRREGRGHQRSARDYGAPYFLTFRTPRRSSAVSGNFRGISSTESRYKKVYNTIFCF